MATRVLTQVLSERRPLDEALEEAAGQIDGDDRVSNVKWLWDVCAGTLRWKGRLDFALDSIALKKKPSGWLRKTLLVAAYQLVVQDRVSPAAVVSETVSFVKNQEGQAPAGFANALLRKIASQSAQWRDWQLGESEKAAWASLPVWMWKRFVSDHGEDWAREYAQKALERPVIWIRRKGAAEPERWSQAESLKSGFESGEFFIQDVSSQVLIDQVTRAVLDSPDLGEPRVLRALDLCAAPGGKARGLAWNGFQVFASDREGPRLRMMRESLSKVAPEIQLVSPSELSRMDRFDLVWVDAPCTGTGVIRRHPDIRWLRDEKELPGLHQVQRELFLKGWERVRPGGYLVYSVCSVLKEEGPALVATLAFDGGVRKQEWFLPSPDGDGFWAILLRKL